MENTLKVVTKYSNINDKFSDEEDCVDPQDQNVSISVGSHGGGSGKAAVLCLMVLAVVLFAVDVSLGIYYIHQTDGIPQSSEGFQKILDKYRSTLESRRKAIKQLEKERRQIDVTRWELEHQKRRGREYSTLLDTVHKEHAGLQTVVALMTVDCGHCLPNWIYIESKCFYLSGPTLAKTSWHDARSNCKRKGADLAIVDSSVKQSSLNMHIQDRSDPNAGMHVSGYWIGLTDVDEEGTWKWLNGEPLMENFWHAGEPNNIDNEDCAANYPGPNPFSAWNDAPCTFTLKWICEMEPPALQSSPDL